MEDFSAREGKGKSSVSSDIRLVYCPKCRNLLTEFPHIPLYRCGECNTILQAKNFKPSMLNQNSFSRFPLTTDSDASPPSASYSKEHASTEDAKSSKIQSYTSCVDTITTHISTTIMGSSSDFASEMKPFGRRNNSIQGNENAYIVTSDPESSEPLDARQISPVNAAISNPLNPKPSDVKEKYLELNGQNPKHDEVSRDPSDLASDEKTVLGIVNFTHEASTSSSGSSSSKYEKGEITFLDKMDNLSISIQEGLAASKLSNRNKLGSPCEQEKSDKSGELYFVQDWMELECNTTYGGSSRNLESQIPEFNHLKILMQINELRDEFLRTCFESTDNVDPHAMVFDRSCRLNSSKTRHGSNHFPSHTMLNCHRFHTLSMFPPHSYSNVYSTQNSCQMYNHPPHPEGKRYYPRQLATCSCCNRQNHNHGFEHRDSRPLEHSMRRHRRPLLGGSCYISCYECLHVLEMPEEFHFLTRAHAKLRCGACFRVLNLSVYEKTRIVPYCFTVGQLQPGEFGDVSDATTGIAGSTPSPNFRRSGGWLSYSGDCEPSPAGSYLTETDARCGIPPPLHSLMGYISASEILYQPDDS